VNEETSKIVLNAANLELSAASVYSDGLKINQAQVSCELDPATERAALSFPVSLPAGSTAQLHVGFHAKLTGSMMGYYKSAWEKEGQTKQYALTQFEVGAQQFIFYTDVGGRRPHTQFDQATAARRAFPCWDEPALKATFAITMISAADTVNLSNMPAISEQACNPQLAEVREIGPLAELVRPLADGNESGKWKITRFETTPVVRESPWSVLVFRLVSFLLDVNLRRCFCQRTF
jgi:aminopeptidase 2